MRHRFGTTAALLAAAILATACDSPQEAEVPAVPEAPKVEIAPPVAPAGPRASNVAEKDVRAAVDAWLAAQNTSDFEAYSSAYGARFEGIKRVGPKTFKYDRDGWLSDRERMFAKKMVVGIDDLEVMTAAKSAVVTFEQTWESGTFKDVGAKQLVFSAGADGLEIVREEMLSSSVVGAQATVPDYDPASAAMVLDGTYYVLSLTPGDVGAGKVQPVGDGRAATRAVDPTKLGELSGWAGKEVEVFDAAGAPCPTKIGELALYATVTPHFGEEQFWRAENKSPGFIAEQVWGMAQGQGVVLVGKLASRCAGGVWGREVGAKSTALQATKADDALTNGALTALRKLPGYLAVQKEFDDASPWDLADGAKPSITRFGDYVVASATAGAGCGNFYGGFWAIWEVRGEKLVLLSDADNPGEAFHPTAAWLVGGKPHFVGTTHYRTGPVFVQPVGTVWQITHDGTFPYLDCPC